MYFHGYKKYNKNVQILDNKNRFWILEVFVASGTNGSSYQ